MPHYIITATIFKFKMAVTMSIAMGTRLHINFNIYISSSSYFCAGQRLTPHNRTLEVRPGRITKKLELKYDYDCERDDTNSLLGVLMFGWDVVIANNE